jgi:hypothetical protein|tara:strand:+ start:2738 stop:3283 length:546 start_codon:yes stop_codon:yes gene_type:complete
MYLPKIVKEAIDESIKIASNKVLSKVYRKLIAKRPHVKDIIDFECDNTYHESVICDALTFNTSKQIKHDIEKRSNFIIYDTLESWSIATKIPFNTIRDFLDHDPICRGIKGGNTKKGIYTPGCYCMAPKQEGCGDYCSNHKNQNTSLVNGQDTSKIVLTNLKTYIEDKSMNKIDDNPFDFL